jgi:uncharacterized membrane protein
MSFIKVDSNQGLEWIKGGIRQITQNPTVFLVNALIILVLSSLVTSVPIVGVIVSMLAAPVFTAGMLFAFNEQHEGREAQIEHLFVGFKDQKKLINLILLGLPLVLWMVALSILGFLFIGGALLGAAGASLTSSVGASYWAGLGIGAVVLFVLFVALGLAASALVVFAVPRVFFDGIEPFSAMKESLRACIANLGAMLIFALILMGIYLVSCLLLIVPILGWIAFFVVALGLSATSIGGIYLAYRSIFDKAG